MQDIALNVLDEEQLYNPFDPRRNLLTDEVKAYLLGEVQIEGRMDGVHLTVCSTTGVDEKRFSDGIVGDA